MSDTPNRYGAQGIYNKGVGMQCCCHMVPLTDICDGCEALRSTKRQPTLVGVDAVRMNPLNDDADEPDSYPCAMTQDGKPAVAEAIKEGLLVMEENDDFAEDTDDCNQTNEETMAKKEYKTDLQEFLKTLAENMELRAKMESMGFNICGIAEKAGVKLKGSRTKDHE